MLKIKLTNGQLILGIDNNNIDQLTKGNPIKVDHGAVGDVSGIIIVYGNSVDDIVDMLNIRPIYEANKCVQEISNTTHN